MNRPPASKPCTSGTMCRHPPAGFSYPEQSRGVWEPMDPENRPLNLETQEERKKREVKCERDVEG